MATRALDIDMVTNYVYKGGAMVNSDLKKIYTTILLMIVSMTTCAYDFSMDGIFYTILSTEEKTVAVTYETTNYNSYSGDIVIPESVEYNGISYKVTQIDDNAFYACDKLANVKIPNTVIKISEYAFCRCIGLTSISIPSSVTNIGRSAVANCSSLKKVTFEDGESSLTLTPTSGSIYGTFRNTSSIESVYIGRNINFGGIWTSAFGVFYDDATLSLSASKIHHVEFGPNVTDCNANYVFKNCQNITSVICNATSVPSNPYFETEVYSNAALVVPDGKESVYSATSGWKSFVNIITPSTTLSGSCGDNATWNYNVTKQELSITGSGDMTDYSYDNIPWSGYRGLISNITIQRGITHIGNYSFHESDEISSINIPNTVTTIGSSAFYGCSSLSSVTIPESIKEISYNAFNDCSSLNSVYINNLSNWCSIEFLCSNGSSNPLTLAKHLYLNNAEIKDLVIPDDVTSISDYAFCCCTGLTSVVIPNSVKSIGCRSFSGCTGVTTVTLPNSVTNIDDYAFNYCTGLKEINCLASSVPTVSSMTFNYDYTAALHVPSESISLYQQADYWKEFSSITGLTCATPVITYSDGKISTICSTEGAKCHVSWSLSQSAETEGSTEEPNLALIVTAYATADGYAQSDTITATLPLSVGMAGDLNGDGKVTIEDVTKVVEKVLKEE